MKEETKDLILAGQLQIFASVFLDKKEQEVVKKLFISLTSEETWERSRGSLSTKDKFYRYRKDMNMWYGEKIPRSNIPYINYKELLNEST